MPRKYKRKPGVVPRHINWMFKTAKFFDLLITVLTNNDLLDKPKRIFNMGESRVQLNNKPGKVLAKKGTRTVLIIKGVNKKPELEEGLPPGSKVYMQKKSYTSSELFYKWLTDHFIPRKPPGNFKLSFISDKNNP